MVPSQIPGDIVGSEQKVDAKLSHSTIAEIPVSSHLPPVIVSRIGHSSRASTRDVPPQRGGNAGRSTSPSIARRHSPLRADEEHDTGWSPRTPSIGRVEPFDGPARTSEEHLDLSSMGTVEGKSAGFAKVWRDARVQNPLVAKVLRAVGLVLMWYIFSILLSLYNKFLLGAEHGKFPAPLLMTTIHFLMQWGISAFMLKCICPSFAPPNPPSRWDYISKVVPSGVGTALDIGFSNLSLVLITVSFYTMCKSSAPVFLLFFAFAFRLESPSWSLVGVITIISVGVLLTVAGEAEFNLEGFILVMVAAVLAGFRWTLTQILLQREKLGLTNPVVTLFYLGPVMATCLATLSIATEPWSELHRTVYFDTPHHMAASAALMVFGGSIAFFMIMSEFVLISETSAVTFTVAGVVKEVVTILVSVVVFGDKFGMVNIIGLCVVILGVSLFNYLRYLKLREGKGGLHGEQATAGKLPCSYELLDKAEETADAGADGTEERGALDEESLRDVYGDDEIELEEEHVSRQSKRP